MTTARYPDVTDELLSAYLDNAVTEVERQQIERAAADDPEVAWRLASLRETVRLLHELPALALPRSFLLTHEQVRRASTETTVTSTAVLTAAAPVRRSILSGRGRPRLWSIWQERWLHFWQSGSPALRNAMAASLAALLVLLVAPTILVPASRGFAPATSVQTDQGAYPAAPAAPMAAGSQAAAQPTATTINETAIGETELPAPAAEAPEAVQDLQQNSAGEPAAQPAAPPASTDADVLPMPAAGAAQAGETRMGSPDESMRSSAVASAKAPAQVPPASFSRSADALVQAAAAAPVPTSKPAPTATAIPSPTVSPPTPMTAVEAAPGATVAAVAAAGTAAKGALPPEISVPPVVASPVVVRLMPAVQLIAALAALAFGLLWWRSRKS